MLEDDEIKAVTYNSWLSEPKRPPRVQLQIIDDRRFSVDGNMYLQASRTVNLTEKSYSQAIRHELRHLTFSPEQWATWADWTVMLAKANYRADEIQQTLNIFTDIQVDRSLFKDYGDDFKRLFQEMLNEYWVEPRLPITLLYLRAHENFMGTNILPKQDEQLERDAQDLEFWALEGNWPVEERILECAKIIRRYIPPPNEESPFHPDGYGKGQGQPRNGQEAMERIAEKAEREGLTPDQAREALKTVKKPSYEGGKGGVGSVEVDVETAEDLLLNARSCGSSAAS